MIHIVNLAKRCIVGSKYARKGMSKSFKLTVGGEEHRINNAVGVGLKYIE